MLGHVKLHKISQVTYMLWFGDLIDLCLWEGSGLLDLQSDISDIKSWAMDSGPWNVYWSMLHWMQIAKYKLI